jgi:hypothetical protein
LDAKAVLPSHEVLLALKTIKKGVVLTIGAGDIDRMVAPLTELLKMQITQP